MSHKSKDSRQRMFIMTINFYYYNLSYLELILNNREARW